MTELKGRDALKVRALGGVKPYKQFLADGVTESKMWKKEYRTFTYGSKAFIAEVSDPFCIAFDASEIYSIDLDTNDADQFSLGNFTTITQEMKMAGTEQKLASYKLVLSAPVSELAYNELA